MVKLIRSGHLNVFYTSLTIFILLHLTIIFFIQPEFIIAQTAGVSRTTFSLNGSAVAGSKSTVIITIENLPFNITKGEYFKLRVAKDTWNFNGARCSLPFRKAAQYSSTTDYVFGQAESDFPQGQTLTISCVDATVIGVGFNPGDVVNSPIVITSGQIEVTIQSYYIGTKVIPPGLGASGSGYPSIDLTPEGNMAFKIITPEVEIPRSDFLIISMAEGWCDRPLPNCKMAKIDSSNQVVMVNAQETTAEANVVVMDKIRNCQVTVLIPANLASSTKYGFICEGFAMPSATTSELAMGGIWSQNGGYRALGDFEIPRLRDALGDKIFNLQLKSVIAGQTTTLSTNILRFPIEVTGDFTLVFALPKQYIFDTDTGADKCRLQQQEIYQNLDTWRPIEADAQIDDNVVKFVVKAGDSISDKWAVTQVVCDNVMTVASHKAINNITLSLYGPGQDPTLNGTKPLYVKKNGALSEVVPAAMGAVASGASQSVTVAGGITNMDITINPSMTGILYGYYIQLRPDHDYGFTSSSVCEFRITNPGTAQLTSGGFDENVKIAVEAVNMTDPNTPVAPGQKEWISDTYTMKVIDKSENKLTLLRKTDNHLLFSCTSVRNPVKEKVENPSLDVVIYHPDFGIANPVARFSKAILPPISPAPLGQFSAIYQPSSIWTGQIVDITIIVNALSNPVPSKSSKDAGSVVFQLPKEWTPSSSAQTQCRCNRIGCTGTTTIDRGEMWTITFRPDNEIPVREGARDVNVVHFTCTNIRTPVQPTNIRNDLKITTMSSTYRIDTTDRAILPAISTMSNSNVELEVVHTLLFDHPKLLEPQELNILQSAYANVFAAHQITAVVLKQRSRSGLQFTIPKLWSDVDDRLVTTLSYNDEEEKSNNLITDEQQQTSSIIENKNKKIKTMGIHDIYQFDETSHVLIISTKLSSSQTGIDKADMIKAMDTDISRQALSAQIEEYLSLEPIFKYTGLSSDGKVYPNSCYNGVQDGDEVDIDCGGSCPKCYNGSMCKKGKDCRTGKCSKDNICTNSAIKLFNSQTPFVTYIILLSSIILSCIIMYSMNLIQQL